MPSIVLAVGDADGYGVGLRGLIVEAGVGSHGDLAGGRVNGELVRACKGVGERVVFRVGGRNRGTHVGPCWRIFGHFSHRVCWSSIPGQGMRETG